MRKLVYGALALSAAMAVSFGVNASQADAKSEKWEVKSCEGDTLTLTTTDKNEPIFVAVPTIKQNKEKTAAVATAANWDYYVADSKRNVEVDLSKYPITKENYLLVKAGYDTDAEATLIKIPASVALSNAKYETTKLVTIKGSDKQPLDSNNLVYYTDNQTPEALTNKTGGSYEVAKLAKYEQTGAAVYVRDAGKTVTEFDPAADAKVKVGTAELPLTIGDNTSVPYITVSQRPGKAVKFNVTKLKNAPKVTVDYVNGKITLQGTAKAPTTYAFGGEMGSLDGTSNVNFGFTAADGIAQSGTVDKKTIVELGKQITTAYGNFYVDVESTGTKKGRTVFAGQKATVLEAVDEETQAETPYVTAVVKYAAKKYQVVLSNVNTETGYIVTVSSTDSTANPFDPQVKTIAKAAKKAGALTITPKTINDPTKIKIEVQKQGDKTTMAFPTVKTELPAKYITVVNDGNTAATFHVTVGKGEDEAADTALAGKIVISNKGGVESAVNSKFDYTGTDDIAIKQSTSGASAGYDLANLVVEYYDTAAAMAGKEPWKVVAANKITKVKDSDSDVVTSISFKMLSNNIRITEKSN